MAKMSSKVAVHVTKALHGSAGETLRRSLAALPGVKQVSIHYPNRVEVHYDGDEKRAGTLMTLIRAHGGGPGSK